MRSEKMDRWLKLSLFKTFLNLGVRVANLAVPRAEATWPQSKITKNVFAKLYRAHRIEAYCGRFDDFPLQPFDKLKDKNFLRVLRLSEKLLLYLGEMDRYYRQWLGVALLLAEDELKKAQESMTYEEFLKLVRDQWEFDVTGAFPKEFFDTHKNLFQKILLTNFLASIAK
jgi:hypothetical protein